MVMTVRATKFGQSSRGNRTWRAACGCKVEILPAALGEVDIQYCSTHGEAPVLLEALEGAVDAYEEKYGPDAVCVLEARAAIAAAKVA